MQKILVIAPHPDDEVLGCGGTIKKYTQRGAEVSLCVVTSAYTPEWSQEFVDNRPHQIRAAADVLGIEDIYCLDLPTVKLDTLPQKELNEKIAGIVRLVMPEILYIPHRGDLNRDHQLVHEAALVAARPTAGQSIKNVLAYEARSETEWGFKPFWPTVYEDIACQMESKLKAMQVYASEVKDFPHPRSRGAIEALATVRGSEAGLKRAEAFMLVRSVR